ncbi:hypothetical protein [Enterococcus ureasiticus]|uniref:Pyridoxamine 5'-phosphate oxidase putative domain-containing protein n=1 Tax=Enterococcus ureasiticus TaxID=903984 RepID=A0A1E5GH51_9ENTE|nr:hypothetical protein [Enterococcus ureasiticus]OEG11977.1 hypothetical protein BCR21_07000 [Enterococcus ureasiticus]
MSKSIEDLLEVSQGVILTTIDRMGFPRNQLISLPIYRNHYYSMLFVVEEQSTLIQSLGKNCRATVCFFTTKPYQAVYVKGIITVQEELKESELNEYLRKYPKLTKLVQPMGLDFQTLTIETGQAESIDQDSSEMEDSCNRNES